MILDIIDKKRRGEALSYEEIESAITGFLNGSVKDYQMSSLLMAICINGMNDTEVLALTDVMLHSGETVDFSDIEGVVVDKHSTGGVGDKTTIILAPLVASLGVPVAKMSGRGLGMTGGTIDKLESIPGFQTQLSEKEFKKSVKKIGCAVMSGSHALVPADKEIYALRDVTGTVESIPLIASSIMSKKLAGGASKIVIDLKVGSGALMKNVEDARKLAKLMVKIGKQYEKETVCVLTNMDTPLGLKIGNALEIEECIDVLKGMGPKDITDLVLYLGSYMVHFSLGDTLTEARIKVTEALFGGSAYEKFLSFIKNQGGRLDEITHSDKVLSIKSPKTGFVTDIDALKVGTIVHKLGAGRTKKTDSIDYGVGIEFSKTIGDFVTEGEELLKVYFNEHDITLREILDCVTIEDDAKEEKPLILEVISSDV